ncbi:hypothetical protein Tco_0300920 [Tanacetum coccineum]
MSNQSEDIQAVGSDTRPPMLDRIDFESWQQRIRLYCKGKNHGEYIFQSIDEVPFKMGTCRDEVVSDTDSSTLGPERDRVVADLSQPEKDRLRAEIRATNILLQGLPRDIYKLINHNTFVMAVKLNKGLKESNHDQLYAYLKQHEVHANENKLLMERLNQQSNDLLALVSNVSPYQYPSSSLVQLQSSYIPPVTYQPRFADNTQQGRQDRVQGNNARGVVAAGNGVAQNRAVDLDEEQLLFFAAGQANTFDDEVDDEPVQVMAQNEDNIFQADQCDAFDSDVDEAPTAQTMFMANLSSVDPVDDAAGPSYD